MDIGVQGGPQVSLPVFRTINTAGAVTWNVARQITKGFLSFRQILATPFYLLALIADMLSDFFGCVAKKIADDKW